MCLFRRLFTPRMLLQSLALRGLRSRHLLSDLPPAPRLAPRSGCCFCGA